MRHIIILILVLFMTGCTNQNADFDRALALRNQILNASGCSFHAVITADYGDSIYKFAMQCSADSNGDMTFTVLQPESIAGITGTISNEGGEITYDGTVLAFSLLADGLVAPVSTPWLWMKALKGGYISTCIPENGGYRLSLDDSYANDTLHMDIFLRNGNIPEKAEIFWKGQRMIILDISDFQYS